MVSLWPWKGDDSSPASFEKTLSTLSNKISKATARHDSLRQSSRRINALWILYTTFAYLLYAIILFLVVGWRQWGFGEYATVLGAPAVIYSVRLAVTTAYTYRINNVQRQIDEFQKQRDKTIEKLKAATKYNTTQELLKKYGGNPSEKAKSSGSEAQRKKSKANASPGLKGDRTGFVPPPTANIPGRSGVFSLPGTPQQATPQSRNLVDQPIPHSAAAAVGPWQRPPSPLAASAEFAPNAFPSAPQYAPVGSGSRWYDRIADALLGEDETLPKNRLALICNKCRLVNGQAPPGVQRLEDVGNWRCAGCGTMNGQEDDTQRIVARIREQAAPVPGKLMSETQNRSSSVDARSTEDLLLQESDDHETDVTQYSDSTNEEAGRTEPKETEQRQQSQVDTPRRRSRRVRKMKSEED
ncbi:MAG: hypothetical protein Q9190_005570 [Brigantiaea leucoxantha]